ncbi:hypothetical protein HYR99_13125 [Candidatus Poribacteria bacterium]|nr:hypothetical protein [Candidatus Poribacteria bacterium]
MSDTEQIRQACLDFSACVFREQAGYQYKVQLKKGIERFVNTVKTDLTALVKVIPTLDWAGRDAVTSFLDELTPWATLSFIEGLWKLARREKHPSVQFNLISALVGYLKAQKSHTGQLQPPLEAISLKVEASYRQQLQKLSGVKHF